MNIKKNIKRIRIIFTFLSIMLPLILLLVYLLKLYIQIRLKIVFYGSIWLWMLKWKLTRAGLPPTLTSYICKCYRDDLSTVIRFSSLKSILDLMRK